MPDNTGLWFVVNVQQEACLGNGAVSERLGAVKRQEGVPAIAPPVVGIDDERLGREMVFGQGRKVGVAFECTIFGHAAELDNDDGAGGVKVGRNLRG